MTTAAARARATARMPVRFTLDGGALGLLEPSHDVPLVSFVVALRSGASADPEGKSGLARVAMRMLRRGYEGMTSEQIDFRIDALGAEVGVDTSASTVAIHAQVIARNVEAFIDLLARMLSTPTFPDDELQRLKRESIAEVVDARDSDRVVAQKAFQRTLFEGHPYGRNAGGTTASIASIEAADVRAFYARYVVQSNIVIGISGDVTADHAPILARRLIAGLSPGQPAPDDVTEPVLRPGRHLLLVDKPQRSQTQMLVGTLGTSPHDDDHVPLTIANAIFGGTFTSRLMREVRSKRGWSYGAAARTLIDRHRASWMLSTFPAARDAAPCLELCIRLTDAWVADGVTSGEVGFIKRYLVRSHAFEVDTANKRLHQALDVELLGLPPDYYTGWLDRVRAVTPETASAAVRRRIDAANLLAVVVGTASEVLEPLRGAVPGLAEAHVVPYDAE
jgi:zinc protease